MIKKATIRQAIENVRELNQKFHEDASKKKNLLVGDDGGSLFLQISLKKIPNIKNIKMIKMPLPNSIPLDGACLITGDQDKKNHKADIEPDILHYKEVLSNCGITGISEVITLRQLRTEYKSYEARQSLLAAFDTFLADKKIVGTLPKVLGRHFFKKRKFPIQIDFKSEDLKRDVENVLSTKVLFLSGHGNSCAVEVAHMDMDDSKIIENVMAAVKNLSEKLPGSWDNIMGMYLRIAKSKAMPIYMSYDDASNVKFDGEKKMDITVDDLSTLPNASVRVYNDGRVECTRKLKNGEIEDSEDDFSISSSEESETQNSRKKKKIFVKNSLPECDQLNDEDMSFQKNSQAKKAKKLKRSEKENVKVEETMALSNDSEDLQTIKLLSETRKMKKSEKEATSMKNVKNTLIDFESSKAAKSLKPAKKIKQSKMETANEEEDEFFPVDSEDSETVDSTIETKKFKKNKKQIASVKQAELFSNQSKGSSAAKSLKPTKRIKQSKMETTTEEEKEFSLDDSEDSETVDSIIETKKDKKNKKQITSIKQAEIFFNQSKDSDAARSLNTTKKIKQSKMEATNVEEEFSPDDSEDSQTVDSAIEIKKVKRNKKLITSTKQAELFSNQSEGSKAAKSLKSTKKMKQFKTETTNEEEDEFFPDDSEDSQTLDSAIEKKKVKKNKKQITSMKQTGLFSNQSKDSQIVKSPRETKKIKSSKMQAKNLECKELPISYDSEDSRQLKFKIQESIKKNRRNPKQEIKDSVSLNSTNEPFNQTKKPNKRKRVDSESEKDIKIFEFKSPKQVEKKKRLEDKDIKQNLAVKKARRNKMKENRLKSK